MRISPKKSRSRKKEPVVSIPAEQASRNNLVKIPSPESECSIDIISPPPRVIFTPQDISGSSTNEGINYVDSSTDQIREDILPLQMISDADSQKTLTEKHSITTDKPAVSPTPALLLPTKDEGDETS